MEFKIRLKNLRTQHGLSQEDLATALGLNQTTVSAWELGKKFPEFFSIILIAKFFDVSTDYLLGLCDIE